MKDKPPGPIHRKLSNGKKLHNTHDSYYMKLIFSQFSKPAEKGVHYQSESYGLANLIAMSCSRLKSQQK
jgi:hypothetical protein